MRRMECFQAISAGLVITDGIAVLSVLSSNASEDKEAAVLLSRDMLRHLHRSIGASLDGGDAVAGSAPAARRKPTAEVE